MHLPPWLIWHRNILPAASVTKLNEEVSAKLMSNETHSSYIYHHPVIPTYDHRGQAEQSSHTRRH